MQYGGTVYILTNAHHEVLYIGVTSDLFTRIPQHINKFYAASFTAKYNCNKLVYYETFGRIEDAIAREKQLKKWNRAWKDKLINDFNPGWKDLFSTLETFRSRCPIKLGKTCNTLRLFLVYPTLKQLNYLLNNSIIKVNKLNLIQNSRYLNCFPHDSLSLIKQ